MADPTPKKTLLQGRNMPLSGHQTLWLDHLVGKGIFLTPTAFW